MKTMMRSFCLLLSLAVISCVTINIYFPAEEIRGAADKIVNEVWGDKLQDGAEESAPEAPDSGSRLLDLLLPTSVYAAQDINVTTPTIRAIKAEMKKRAGQLIDFLNAGNVGLGNNGLLKIRDTGGLNLQQRGQLNQLVNAENQDRQRLYKEIAVANDFPEKVDEVQEIFAESWRKQAKKGWYLETPNGNWQRK